MKKTRVMLAAGMTLGLSLGMIGQMAAYAEEGTWPTGTVTLYVPAAAGGTTDSASRLFAENWRDQTGQQFVVVNDTTGNGAVACETVRNSKADGLNLLLYNTSLFGTISTGQYAQTIDDFAILGAFLDAAPESTCILVNADSEFETLDDLVAYGKEHPGELICGQQINSRGHFVEILIEDQLGFQTTIVDGGSNAETITKLLGNNIDMCCITTTSSAQYVEAGDLRALSVNGGESLLMPDVPTLEELGYENVDLPMVHFLFGPKDMSEGDIANVSSMLEKSVTDPEIVEVMKNAGQTCIFKTPEESAEWLSQVQADFDKAYGLIQEMQQ